MNRHDGACVISSDRYVMQGCLQLHATINKDKTLYMSRKKKPLPVLENVTITDYAAEGKSIARVNDLVVFVPFAGNHKDSEAKRRKDSSAVRPLRAVRRLQVAECAIRRAAEDEAEAGARPAYAHRQG